MVAFGRRAAAAESETAWGPFGGRGGRTSGGVQIWDIERGSLIHSIADETPVTFVVYSPRWTRAAGSGGDQPPVSTVPPMPGICVLSSPRVVLGGYNLNMNSDFDAIYERGVFRPLQPVDIPERTKVHLHMQESSEVAQPPLASDAAAQRVVLRKLLAWVDRRKPNAAARVSARDHDHLLYGWQK